MRGSDEGSGQLFSYVDLEARVRRDHPLRVIRAVANEALGALVADFAALYSKVGRPRSRRNGCCGRCCCRLSILSARNGS